MPSVNPHIETFSIDTELCTLSHQPKRFFYFISTVNARIYMQLLKLWKSIYEHCRVFSRSLCFSVKWKSHLQRIQLAFHVIVFYRSHSFSTKSNYIESFVCYFSIQFYMVLFQWCNPFAANPFYSLSLHLYFYIPPLCLTLSSFSLYHTHSSNYILSVSFLVCTFIFCICVHTFFLFSWTLSQFIFVCLEFPTKSSAKKPVHLTMNATCVC